MGNHTAFYAFDLDGHELSKQLSTCEAFSDLDPHSVVACPISTETDIEIKDSTGRAKVLLATDASGKKVRYLFKDGRYEQFSVPRAAKPPSVPRATALNEQGMQLMQQKNYEAAIPKFEEAAQLNQGDPLFANNAGFAYYKLERYEDSLYWFNKAIEIDPNRAMAFLNLGDACAKLGRNAEAREAYQKYLSQAPDSKAAPDVKKKLEALGGWPR
jgi:tetratricopeptide (TPR) repeat protein